MTESNATLTIPITTKPTGTLEVNILRNEEAQSLDVIQIKEAHHNDLIEGYKTLSEDHKKFVDISSNAVFEIIPPWD